MADDIVSLEIAKLAKKAGFDKESDFFYVYNGLTSDTALLIYCEEDFFYWAPNITQLNNWLREENGLNIFIQSAFEYFKAESFFDGWRWKPESNKAWLFTIENIYERDNNYFFYAENMEYISTQNEALKIALNLVIHEDTFIPFVDAKSLRDINLKKNPAITSKSYYNSESGNLEKSRKRIKYSDNVILTWTYKDVFKILQGILSPLLESVVACPSVNKGEVLYISSKEGPMSEVMKLTIKLLFNE